MKHITALAPLLILIATTALAQTPGNIEAAEYDPTENRWFISNGTSLLRNQQWGCLLLLFRNSYSNAWNGGRGRNAHRHWQQHRPSL